MMGNMVTTWIPNAWIWIQLRQRWPTKKIYALVIQEVTIGANWWRILIFSGRPMVDDSQLSPDLLWCAYNPLLPLSNPLLPPSNPPLFPSNPLLPPTSPMPSLASSSGKSTSSLENCRSSTCKLISSAWKLRSSSGGWGSSGGGCGSSFGESPWLSPFCYPILEPTTQVRHQSLTMGPYLQT